MFKIKGFSLFCLFILLLVYQPSRGSVTAQNKDSVKCYGMGEEVVDRSIPCCDGLDQLTEVGTNKIFCDKKPSTTSHYFIWGLILIFPLFLLVFVIFGIRNKMAQRKNKITE